MTKIGTALFLLFFGFFISKTAYGAKDYRPSTFIIKDMVALNAYWQGDNEGDIYRRIRKEFQDDYQKIGEAQIKKLGQDESLSVVGGFNHVGINYSKGLVDFSVDLKREIAPDLFDDKRYIVIDHFHIYVEAKTLLGNLRSKGIIRMTEDQFRAFGGITFKRSYRYVHFADSFYEALTTDLHKLFLGFDLFRQDRYLNLEPYEFISKEDSMTVKIGGFASFSSHGFRGNVAQMSQFHRLSKLEIQRIGKDDRASEDERFRISLQKIKGKGMLGHLAIQADFLRLLQIGLFRYDFSYDYLDDYRINLSFDEKALLNLQNPEGSLYRALGDVLKKGKGDLDVFAPYLVSEEHRREEIKKSKYSLLLRGSSRECKTAHVEIAREGKIKSFFRHTYTKIKYKKDLVSHLFASLLKTFIRPYAIVKNQRFEEKSICMEYEGERNILEKKEDLVFDDAKEKMTLSFKKNYFDYKSDKKSKQRCVDILKDCPGVDQKVIDSVRSGELAGGIKLKTTFVMNHQAIDHFNRLDLVQVYDALGNVCNTFQNRQKRFCKRNLYDAYDDYFKELTTDNYSPQTYLQCMDRLGRNPKKYTYKWATMMDICMQRISRKREPIHRCAIPLWRLKDFVDALHKYTDNKKDMYALFGAENIFFYATLEGRNIAGENMSACFSDGTFSGTGLIDSYKRQEKIRAPAAIILDK